MNRRRFKKSPIIEFEIHRVTPSEKVRHSDSPTSSILKTPTAIFVTTRSSSAKRLKFANGPVDLQTLKNGSRSNNESTESHLDVSESAKSFNGDIALHEKSIEVAISPNKTMEVSPESWEAFLEYKKYSDYANETEKTDYTYSRLSKYRHKEIIPGFLIRPNLSRSSIYSRKSSVYLPGNQSSLSDSSLNYDFNLHSSPRKEIIYDFKSAGKTNKSASPISGSRSKYYLRSSSFEDADIGELGAKPVYLEKEYFSDSPPESFYRKSYLQSAAGSETPQSTSLSTTNYLTKMRSLNLDDDTEDFDEVDDKKSNKYQKLFYNNVGLDNKSRTGSNTFSNFFTTIFLYLTTIGSKSRDLFSKHILRKNVYSDAGKFRFMTGADSISSWVNEKPYSSAYYYSDRYGGLQKSWYQRLFSYCQQAFSRLSNLFLGNTGKYSRLQTSVHTSKKRKWWWLLIPFLLLAGSFLGYIDFFSNPKAILNTMYNFLFFVPSFLYYTIMVFIPRLIFEFIPYFFIMFLPNFIMVTVPQYFSATVHFLKNISLVNIWNMLLALPFTVYSTLAYFTSALGKSLFGFLINTVSLGYSLTSNYLMLFFSNFCVQTYYLTMHLSNYALKSFEIVRNALHYLLDLF